AHAGDPAIMARTLALAARLGVACGAHPGYPDRAGFGRRQLPIGPEELRASLVAQLGALAAIARDVGVPLRHVKPHGALYHRAAHDPVVAATVAAASASVLPGLPVVGPAGSALLGAAAALGLPVRAEGFADRRYAAAGGLVPRGVPGAVLGDPAEAAAQARAIVRDGAVPAADGSRVTVVATTLCIHGDSPGAPAIAAAVRAALVADGVRVVAPDGSA
ncbi:MAG: 5-oxoprolinase subunit PxpA, partial [Chloroflexota bacterium]